MSQANIILDTLVFSDTVESNDPQQQEFNWRQVWEVSSVSYPSVQTLSLSAGAYTEISLPSGVATWVMIYADQDLDVVISPRNDIGVLVPPTPWDYTTAQGQWISPSDEGTKDGVAFIRSYTRTLIIGVPGDENASVTIFTGL